MTCSVEECTKKGAYVKGLCPMHYQRMRLHGDINYRQSRDPSAIARRFWEKVVKGDSCWNWTGAIKRGPRAGYGYFHVVDKDVAAHRYSYELHNGPIPQGMLVDHICHNRACVNPNHLRLATNKQNAENRAGARVDSKSGVRGVIKDANRPLWRAGVRHYGTYYDLGGFPTAAEAEAAVVAKRIELYTHNYLDRCAS